MKKQSEAEFAGNYIAAAAHLLAGSPERYAEFNNRVAIMFGAPVNTPTLIHWGDWVRETGRPIIYFHFQEGVPNMPMIAMVDVRDGRTSIFESCFLWLRHDGAAVQLVPNGFKFGAYVIDTDLSLKHLKRSPVRTFKAGEAGMIRAYDRLAQIFCDQVESGVDLPLPMTLERRAA